jgi:hypothetical protein
MLAAAPCLLRKLNTLKIKSTLQLQAVLGLMKQPIKDKLGDQIRTGHTGIFFTK